MTDEIAIKVSGLSKTFKLPHEKSSSLKSALINFRKKKRGYENQQALKDVSFEVKKGEFFGIVGRNGSGKSTLLKMLAGIYTPDTGSIVVNGKLTPFIELGVGFNPELTGRENVFLNGALLGFSRQEMFEMYDDIVDFAEIERFMDQKLKNYSSGMQVRLAFSIAIRAETDILILDEVLAVGDANFQKKCFDYFKQLKLNHKTVILVSHDMNSVNKFSDRALLLDSGRIVTVGRPEDVSDEYVRRNSDGGQILSVTPKKADVPQSKVTVSRLRLLDKNGKKSSIFTGGEKVAVEVSYVCKENIDVLNIGIGLVSRENGYVLGYNTKMDGIKVKVKKTGTYTLSFDSLPLLHGSYFLNVVLFGEEEAEPYQLKREELNFEVLSVGRARNYKGVVEIDHEWMAES